jgi:ATP-binding cassette subfamily F protein uup
VPTSSRAASDGEGGPPGGSTSADASAGPSPAEAREARKTMARVERQLARLAEREDRIHAAMAEAATDHARVLDLNRELREVVDERELLELEWLEAADVVG